MLWSYPSWVQSVLLNTDKQYRILRIVFLTPRSGLADVHSDLSRENAEKSADNEESLRNSEEDHRDSEEEDHQAPLNQESHTQYK